MIISSANNNAIKKRKAWIKAALLEASGGAIEGISAATEGESRGLGDTIAKMTKAIGIKPCGGCKKRQERLNKAVPYKGRLKALEEKGK